jgi:endonuclease YncB( thermonuclease family)
VSFKTASLTLIVTLIALGSMPAGAQDAPALIPAATTQTCRITSVHDGDSLRVRCAGHNRTIPIRLAQLDAPELNQAHGLASRDYLRSICPIQDDAVIHSLGQDQYRRILAEVYCGGIHANVAMIESGHAWVYDDYAHDEALYRAQDAARTARLGLWAGRNAIAPWRFRRTRP